MAVVSGCTLILQVGDGDGVRVALGLGVGVSVSVYVGVGVGVCVAVGVGTMITIRTLCPKSAPLGLRMRQLPV